MLKRECHVDPGISVFVAAWGSLSVDHPKEGPPLSRLSKLMLQKCNFADFHLSPPWWQQQEGQPWQIACGEDGFFGSAEIQTGSMKG